MKVFNALLFKDFGEYCLLLYHVKFNYNISFLLLSFKVAPYILKIDQNLIYFLNNHQLFRFQNSFYLHMYSIFLHVTENVSSHNLMSIYPISQYFLFFEKYKLKLQERFQTNISHFIILLKEV
jgi:hypothetical protein